MACKGSLCADNPRDLDIQFPLPTLSPRSQRGQSPRFAAPSSSPETLCTATSYASSRGRCGAGRPRGLPRWDQEVVSGQGAEALPSRPALRLYLLLGIWSPVSCYQPGPGRRQAGQGHRQGTWGSSCPPGRLPVHRQTRPRAAGYVPCCPGCWHLRWLPAGAWPRRSASSGQPGARRSRQCGPSGCAGWLPGR